MDTQPTPENPHCSNLTKRSILPGNDKQKQQIKRDFQQIQERKFSANEKDHTYQMSTGQVTKPKIFTLESPIHCTKNYKREPM